MTSTMPTRKPPIIIPAPKPSKNAPATLFFIHDYSNVASSFNRSPPNALSVAHHVHSSRALQHLKIVIPEALPSKHAKTKQNVWYSLAVPYPSAGDADRAAEEIDSGLMGSGTLARDENDMIASMDYFESLIRAEIESGTPTRNIAFMGYSQGATILTLFIMTRRLAAELGGIISVAGFSAAPMKSATRMQKENGLERSWSKETRLLLLHGKKDAWVPLSIFWYWLGRLQGFADQGHGIASIESKIIPEMGHPLAAEVWPHVREFLERVVPIPARENSLKL